MLEFATPFHAQVRNLKSPTSSAFDATAWHDALTAAKNPTESDMGLALAAMWLAAEATALRRLPQDPEFAALSANATVTLAVATINREYLVADELSGETMEQAHKEGAISFGHMALGPLPLGSTRQSATADDAIEAAVDAAKSWLFDAYASSTVESAASIPEDLAPAAVRAIRRYSIQHGLNDLWNQCYWAGWRLTKVADDLIWAPSDMQLATRLQACRIRQAENFMNYPFIDMAAWTALKPEQRQRRALPRTVTDVTSGPHRKIRIGRPSCRSRRPPSFLIERAGLEGSYLDFLLDRSFPNEKRFTCQFLLQAWHAILDLALALAKSQRPDAPLSMERARTMALLVSRKELLQVLTKALGVDESAAKAVIAFLTFKPRSGGDKGHRGLWAAPIVPIPGEDRLALALPVLVMSNPLRKAEAWLEKGGLDDNLSEDARGDLYEQEYRRKVCKAIAENKLLKEARCAPSEIKKTADFEEQIDLLVRLGDLLIVGEVKCWLFPADPYEQFNHMRKLRAAAEQAKRKAGLLQGRPDVAAKALGLTEDECRKLRVVPLVIMNQGFGFSLNVDGCAVTDAAFLATYLGAGTIATAAAIDTRTGLMEPTTTTLYERETQAADRFEAAMASPIVLQRFLDRLNWTAIPFPTVGTQQVYFTAPRLGDLTGDERLHAQLVTRAIAGS